MVSWLLMNGCLYKLHNIGLTSIPVWWMVAIYCQVVVVVSGALLIVVTTTGCAELELHYITIDDAIQKIV